MQIKPFRAYRYDRTIVQDAGRCLAPPYDVIDETMRQQLYEQSEFNIARVARPQSGQKNKYDCAASFLNEWIKKGILKQDDDESIYAYVQDFELAGAWFHRVSFIALAKLEPFGPIVRAHENTMDGPRKDRLELKKATEADIGLVFMLYEDPKQIADTIIEQSITDDALIDYTDSQSVRHQLFAITDGKRLADIIEMMAEKACIIADGHHRYETGLNYAKLSANPKAQYQMMAFSNICHEGLIVLATHRLISGLENFSFGNLISQLSKNFDLQKIFFNSDSDVRGARHKMLTAMKAGHARDENTFGIYGGDKAFYVATLKDSAVMDAKAAQMSKPWRKLDVAILSQLVLDDILGIGKDKLAQGGFVQYVKDSGSKSKDLVSMIDAGQGQVVFFLNPPKIKQIQDVADAGERMPQKSTYFYPKIFTGLTINKLK